MKAVKLVHFAMAPVLSGMCVLLLNGNVFYMLVGIAVCLTATAVSYTDIKTMLIPNAYQIILGFCGVAMLFADKECGFVSHIIGAVCGFALFYLVAIAGKLVLRRDALGGGDIKLALVSGLILGWQRLLFMMLIASVTGSVFMLVRRGRGVETPFAPFLSLGLVTAVLCGNAVIQWYISLFL